jgi:hypothetical protein
MNAKVIVSWSALALILGVLFWVDLTRNANVVDWNFTYYPAARALIALQSPYTQAPLFFAPAWSLLPLIPFVFFSPAVGGALFFVASLLGFAYVGYRAGCTPIGIAALILSAPVANCLQTGNVEWLPLLGVFLPPPIGMVFLSMKPQTTIGIMIFLVYQASKQGFWQVVRVCAATIVLFVLTWVAYGWWFLRIGGAFTAAGPFVIHLWPYGIPIGLLGMALAIRRKDTPFALAASPFLSPYTILITWSGFILSFARSTKSIVLMSLLSWVFWIAFRSTIP